jgi:hypothetical protein
MNMRYKNMTIQRSTGSHVSSEPTIKGVGGNPGLIIDSYDLKGPDGYIIYDQGDEVEYLGGEAVRADGPGQKVIESKWFAAGTLRDTMLLSVVFWTVLGDGGTTIARYTNILTGYIYKRHPRTKQIIKTSPLSFVNDRMSGDIGITPRGSDYNYLANQWLQFDAKYEYKFELSTVHSLEPNQGIIVDYMYLQFGNRTAYYSQGQRSFGGSIQYGEPVNIIENCNITVATDGSGNGSRLIVQRKIGDAVDYATNCSYLINDVLNVIPTFYDGSSDGSAGLEVKWAASTSMQGGWQVSVDVQNSTPNTTLYLQVTIIGVFNPSAV